MKKMVIGLLIGLTIGYSLTAYAAIGDTVSAVFSSFNYVVNGTSKAVDSPVLVYEGTSYVRTTDIANMLGFDVTYKADSRTIEFNNGVTSIPTKAPISSLSVTTATYTPTPDPITTSTPVPSMTPIPIPSPTTTVTVTPTPTPVPNYAGYNAALARLQASVVEANNKLYLEWYKAYNQYKDNSPEMYKTTYDNLQNNIKSNNDQLELDKLALKFQFNIPQSY